MNITGTTGLGGWEGYGIPPQLEQANKPVLQENTTVVTEDKPQIGVEIFSHLVGGKEKFEKLPQLDFNTLGTKQAYIGNDKYVDTPAWVGLSGYPDSISVSALKKIDGDIIRGVNGFKNHEYLMVKFIASSEASENFPSPGMFVYFCNNETGGLRGCPIHDSGNVDPLDSYIARLKLIQDKSGSVKKLDRNEKLRELFAEGIIRGVNSEYEGQTVRLMSKELE
jgi:hypothetical protein